MLNFVGYIAGIVAILFLAMLGTIIVGATIQVVREKTQETNNQMNIKELGDIELRELDIKVATEMRKRKIERA